MLGLRRSADAALVLLPGAGIVWLSFNAGGYFPDATGLAAVAVAVAVLVRLLLARQPLEGLSPLGAAAVVALGLYAGWTLASGLWSDAMGRAMVEHSRALLYLSVLALFASLPRTTARASWLVRSVAAGIVVVAVSALITRVLPELWPTAGITSGSRLSYPLTYWNALGVLAATGIVLTLHLTSAVREPRAVRVLAAAVMPALVATVVFTFSRGAIAAGLVGVGAYLILARPGALTSGALATLPTALVAAVAAYRADLLTTAAPTPAAVSQGEQVTIVITLTMLAAAVLRGVLLRVDERLTVPRRGGVGLAAAGIVAAIAAAAAFDAPGVVERQYDEFVEERQLREPGNARPEPPAAVDSRRRDQWRVALDAARDAPVLGTGAGTYANLWARDRSEDFAVADAHSLYLEVPAELGIVGLLLLVAALAAIVTALARARRDDAVFAAMLAAVLTWILHAGVDWDWEMPAVTLSVFVFGGIASARGPGAAPMVSPIPRAARVVAGLAVIALATTPWRVAGSEARLRESTRAFAAGDCRGAIDAARAANAALGARAEPFAVIGFCDARLGANPVAVRMLEKAVERDPGNWEWRYGLGLTRAAGGLDPRAAIAEARRLNPRSRLLLDVAADLGGTTDPDEWRRRAARARVPLR